jgi:hypothetical protein
MDAPAGEKREQIEGKLDAATVNICESRALA